MSGLRRLRELWSEHPITLVGAILHRIPLHPIRIVYFRRLELHRVAPATRTPDEAIVVAPAGREDLDLLVRCFDKRAIFEKRFEAGEICLAARADGGIVGYEWFSTKSPQVEERYGYTFDLPSDALYAYDAYTSESHRGRGVWREVMIAAEALMAREGKRRVLAHVEYGNPVSYRAHLKVGYRPIERYLFASALGLKLLARTSAEPPA